MMRRLTQRTIELWVEAREGVAAVNPVIAALVGDLVRLEASVTIRVAEEEVVETAGRSRRPDLVLLKSATTLALSRALADEAAGIRFLNSAQATVEAHDKAYVIARLAAAGLPVPTTFLIEGTNDASVPRGCHVGMWVAKPTRGVHGVGVVTHSELVQAIGQDGSGPTSDTVVADGTRLVEQHIGEDPDLKVYAVGNELFAGRKSFDATSYARDDIASVELGHELRELVHGVGEALGLRLFGVDLRIDVDGRPVVVDVNPFPGYRGFPSAAVPLATEIRRALVAA